MPCLVPLPSATAAGPCTGAQCLVASAWVVLWLWHCEHQICHTLILFHLLHVCNPVWHAPSPPSLPQEQQPLSGTAALPPGATIQAPRSCAAPCWWVSPMARV
jgi:hypothetical protein